MIHALYKHRIRHMIISWNTILYILIFYWCSVALISSVHSLAVRIMPQPECTLSLANICTWSPVPFLNRFSPSFIWSVFLSPSSWCTSGDDRLTHAEHMANPAQSPARDVCRNGSCSCPAMGFCVGDCVWPVDFQDAAKTISLEDVKRMAIMDCVYPESAHIGWRRLHCSWKQVSHRNHTTSEAVYTNTNGHLV